MNALGWILGLLLASIWLDRLRDALNIRRVPDITRPEWDRLKNCISQADGGREGRGTWEARPIREGHGVSRAEQSSNLCHSERASAREEPAFQNLAAASVFPRVRIIVPARNEAAHVETALHSMLALDYPDFEVFAIDDRSTDSTGEILDRIAASHTGLPPLHVLHITDLPSGWLGKPHAMWTAAEQATEHAGSAARAGFAPAAVPAWLLFTDADVRFRPDCLRRAVAYAEQEHADHLVLIPTYSVHSVGEKIMLAGFQLLFIFGHRPWKVDDPDSADFIGLGPFNLIRRTAYQAMGTFRALRLEVIEDMKLGKLVKMNRLAQRNVFGPGLLPWSWGSGAFGLVRNLTKNLFALMQFRSAKALGACALWLFFNVAPLVGAAFAPGWAKLPYAIALAAIAAIYFGMSRRTSVPAWTFLLHPLSALLIVYTMLRSMAHTLRHRGVIWRGTRYELEELRKGMV